MWTLSRPGDVRIVFSAGKCPTAKACMLLTEHRKFVRCNVDSERLTAAETDFTLMFVSRLLDQKYGKKGSREMKPEKLF